MMDGQMALYFPSAQAFNIFLAHTKVSQGKIGEGTFFLRIVFSLVYSLTSGILDFGGSLGLGFLDSPHKVSWVKVTTLASPRIYLTYPTGKSCRFR